MRDAVLPRLLYVADVPVESSHHGSALMYRALEAYPADRLTVVETGVVSKVERRLAGVRYEAVEIAAQRWLNSRLHGAYSAWVSAVAGRHARRIGVFGGRAEAVLTVGHGFGWITAAAFATERRLPLHLVVHDDWPRLSAIAMPWRGWLDRRFGAVYRAARTRLCISPFMAEAYEHRYGAPGVVMFPARASRGPVFPAKTARALDAGDELIIGYGGNSGPEMMTCLRELARALPGTRTRLEVFGPFDLAARRELAAVSEAITFAGFVPFDQMIRELRARADVLFVPMPFDEVDRDNLIVSFPSKLADYTAAGLPLLIYGPPYSSVVRWARTVDGVAAVVDDQGSEALRRQIELLRPDQERRQRLAERATEAGATWFDATTVREVLYASLRNGSLAVRPA